MPLPSVNARALFPLLLAPLLFACATPAQMPAKSQRKEEIVRVLLSTDEPLMRARPALVSGKYARMAKSPYAFYRGNVPIALHDFQHNRLGASAFLGQAMPVLSLGDPHPENFGMLLSTDGSLVLTSNDLDAAAFAPYLWDLRRLAAGMALAARVANEGDDGDRRKTEQAAEEIARAAAEGYARAIEKLVKGETPKLIEKGDSDDAAIVEDLLERAEKAKQERAELKAFTVIGKDEKRALRRGSIDEEDPSAILRDLPGPAYAALAESLEAYRQTLKPQPSADSFAILDAAQRLGAGVGSFPRIRVIVLLRGRSDSKDDDLLLELKEMASSPLSDAFKAPVAYASQAERMRAAAQAVWATEGADPYWGMTQWMGLECQVRTQSEAHKTIRVSRMKGKRGKPKALRILAEALGVLIARAHAKTPATSPDAITTIAREIQQNEKAFLDEQAQNADQYAAQVIADWELFQEALNERGPLLGFNKKENPDKSPSAPSAPSDLALLFQLDH